MPHRELLQHFPRIDGQHLAEISAGGEAEVNEAVSCARAAFPNWASLGPKGRQPILEAFAEGILANAGQLSKVRDFRQWLPALGKPTPPLASGVHRTYRSLRVLR